MHVPVHSVSTAGSAFKLRRYRCDKTLAKVANVIAKKHSKYCGLCDLRSGRVRAELLSALPELASAAKLAKIGAQTAADLAALDPDHALVAADGAGGRTVYELRGISCLPLELMEPLRKGIASHAAAVGWFGFG